MSHGAKRVAKLGVIVRRLDSIENLGSMDVLCTDKYDFVRNAFPSSRPTPLLASTAIVIAISLVIPYLPFDSVSGFVPLPAPLMLAVIGLTLAYVAAAEIAKKFFLCTSGECLGMARRVDGMARAAGNAFDRTIGGLPIRSRGMHMLDLGAFFT